MTSETEDSNGSEEGIYGSDVDFCTHRSRHQAEKANEGRSKSMESVISSISTDSVTYCSGHFNGSVTTA